jgi:predicted phosphate transport protein (TIGR00153 family)
VIFSKLLPREERFSGLFAEHAQRIADGARAFAALIEHYDDPALRERHAAEVDAAERSADHVTAQVNEALHKLLLTPARRQRVHGLISAMDDVLDLLRDVTGVLPLYDVRSIPPNVRRLADITLRCCLRLQHAVTLLQRLGDADVAEAMMKTCAEIDLLESDADRVTHEAIGLLFREEPDVRELIKLKAVYEQLEEVSDRCEDVAKLIESIVLESA